MLRYRHVEAVRDRVRPSECSDRPVFEQLQYWKRCPPALFEERMAGALHLLRVLLRKEGWAQEAEAAGLGAAQAPCLRSGGPVQKGDLLVDLP
jgi:hypothetical protein